MPLGRRKKKDKMKHRLDKGVDSSNVTVHGTSRDKSEKEKLIGQRDESVPTCSNRQTSTGSTSIEETDKTNVITHGSRSRFRSPSVCLQITSTPSYSATGSQCPDSSLPVWQHTTSSTREILKEDASVFLPQAPTPLLQISPDLVEGHKITIHPLLGPQLGKDYEVKQHKPKEGETTTESKKRVKAGLSSQLHKDHDELLCLQQEASQPEDVFLFPTIKYETSAPLDLSKNKRATDHSGSRFFSNRQTSTGSTSIEETDNIYASTHGAANPVGPFVVRPPWPYPSYKSMQPDTLADDIYYGRLSGSRLVRSPALSMSPLTYPSCSDSSLPVWQLSTSSTGEIPKQDASTLFSKQSESLPKGDCERSEEAKPQTITEHFSSIDTLPAQSRFSGASCSREEDAAVHRSMPSHFSHKSLQPDTYSPYSTSLPLSSSPFLTPSVTDPSCPDSSLPVWQLSTSSTGEIPKQDASTLFSKQSESLPKGDREHSEEAKPQTITEHFSSIDTLPAQSHLQLSSRGMNSAHLMHFMSNSPQNSLQPHTWKQSTGLYKFDNDYLPVAEIHRKRAKPALVPRLRKQMSKREKRRSASQYAAAHVKLPQNTSATEHSRFLSSAPVVYTLSSSPFLTPSVTGPSCSDSSLPVWQHTTSSPGEILKPDASECSPLLYPCSFPEIPSMLVEERKRAVNPLLGPQLGKDYDVKQHKPKEGETTTKSKKRVEACFSSQLHKDYDEQSFPWKTADMSLQQEASQPEDVFLFPTIKYETSAPLALSKNKRATDHSGSRFFNPLSGLYASSYSSSLTPSVTGPPCPDSSLPVWQHSTSSNKEILKQDVLQLKSLTGGECELLGELEPQTTTEHFSTMNSLPAPALVPTLCKLMSKREKRRSVIQYAAAAHVKLPQNTNATEHSRFLSSSPVVYPLSSSTFLTPSALGHTYSNSSLPVWQHSTSSSGEILKQDSSMQSESFSDGDGEKSEVDPQTVTKHFSTLNTQPPQSHLQLSSRNSCVTRKISYLPRCHSMSSLSKRPLTKSNFTRSNSLPDILFKEFTPVITPDFDDETYRFQCCCPGLYQCTVTGLVFNMKGEGDVVYRIVPWNRRLLGQHHKKPAGPLFDIKCLQQSVCQLHLPHCEIRSTSGCQFLSVAHVNDEGIEFISPHKITETHVVINITGFSGFGNVKDEDSPPAPVRALVLLFYRPSADPDPDSQINVLLLPKNVSLRNVLRTRKKLFVDERYIETASDCKMHPNQVYTLSTCPQDDSVLVQPTEAEFDCENYDNYIPSFQVDLEKIIKHMKLSLKDFKTSHSVWERRVCVSSTGLKRSCGLSTVIVPPKKKLKTIWSSFVDAISEPVLQSLLDKLLEKDVITDSERESANAKQSKRDKARFVINTVMDKDASSEMTEFLRELDPFLSKHLGLT